MFPVERQRWLVSQARGAGRVDVSEAAAELGVAVETIRRDLQDLERRGALKRVHGGAVPVDGAVFERPLAQRNSDSMVQEKRALATKLCELITDADSIFLDEGSTAQYVAEILQPKRPLTVVTSALASAVTLSQRENIRLVILGGRLRSTSLATADNWAVTMLKSMVVDIALLGANGVTLEHGCTCADQSVAEVKAQALASSRQKILACDNSKFGVDSFVRFAEIEDFDFVVSDDAVDRATAQAIAHRGPKVVIA